MAAERRVGSRLIKHERKKLMKQIFLFSGLALLLVLIFMFVILPLFIRTINSILDTNPIADTDQAVLLQAPALSAPVPATNSAQLKVSGIDYPDHLIVFVVNGEQQTEVTTEDDGSFSTIVELTEGENSIAVFSEDQEENQSDVSQSYSVELDTDDPELEVTEPADGAEISSRQAVVTVKGTTDPNARVYLNDRVIFPASDGSFSSQVNLSEGDNELIVRSVDKAGNETELTLQVKYQP